ncbi:MAG TPA: hypothetical protein VH502_02685 [Actinoplanes sp.]
MPPNGTLRSASAGYVLWQMPAAHRLDNMVKKELHRADDEQVQYDGPRQQPRHAEFDALPRDQHPLSR